MCVGGLFKSYVSVPSIAQPNRGGGGGGGGSEYGFYPHAQTCSGCKGMVFSLVWCMLQLSYSCPQIVQGIGLYC